MKYGFYVEGRYFASKQHQAMGYARRLSTESKRAVKVEYLGPASVWLFATVDAGVRP